LLDRDGTIIVERHYLSSPNEVELLPGAGEALARLQALEIGLCVITNQSGVRRGYFDLNQVAQVHARLEELLAGHGVELDGIYLCPHLPQDECECRKPRPGLAQRASKELEFDLHTAFVIGDKACDVELAKRVNARSILVRTGYGAEVEAQNAADSDFVTDDLGSAAHIINSLVC
jgi:D-glycero-D-manno-heptose 1,7-bisphosphate phosphatase